MEVPYRGSVLGTAQDILGKCRFINGLIDSLVDIQVEFAVVALMWVQEN